jgi:hypothetical protein
MGPDVGLQRRDCRVSEAVIVGEVFATSLLRHQIPDTYSAISV